MSSNSPDELRHPSLKRTLRGKLSAQTIEFRNLKYASVPGRYRDSVLNDEIKSGTDGDAVVDATQFGPSCPQHRAGQAWGLTLAGNVKLPFEPGQGPEEKMDELECLNLNVTAPKSVIQESGETALPVFVWVHGGALSIGSNSWPQYQMRRLVERSIEIGKPVVGVAINYRLSVFGFLASDDIKAAGNMGYKDQVQAFRWIKRHIAGFGGDPNNVTAAGESAGGISLSTLLCANVGAQGLFERVVIMSGEATLRKWRNAAWQQKMFEEQSTYLKLDVADAEARRKALLETDAEELAQKLPLAQHFTATVDNDFVTREVTIEAMMSGQSAVHKPSWCREFVIGDTAHDGLILKSRILNQPNALDCFKEACAKHISPAETQVLLTAYNLQTPLPNKQEEDEHLLELVSELRFHLPALTAHQAWKASTPPKRASRYHFHVPNPLEGSFQGLASHELDVVYLLNNFEDHFDEHNRGIARAVQDRFLRLATGERWADDGKAVVFERAGVAEVDEELYDAKYRGERGAVLRAIGMEKLWRVAEMWQNVRSEEEVS